MELEKAYLMAREKMEQHGLAHWTFKFDGAVRRLGYCSSHRQVLSFSTQFIKLNDESVFIDTVLHEIAHALVGHQAGHGYIWKQKAKELGCSPKRCADGSKINKPSSKYEGICSKCGWKSAGRNRMRKGAKFFHKACGGDMNYTRVR